MTKEKKYNIKDIIKENYKLIIPIVLMIVIFIAFLIYYKVMISNNYTKDETIKAYQYFYEKKYEYNLTVSKNRKDVIVGIEPQDIKINYDSTPIYYQEQDIIIFPEDMSVVMPTLNCAEYLSKGYSYITYENGIYTLTTDKYNKKLNHYFLYDGKNLYFFIEPVTLTVNNEKIELSSLSYLIAKYNNSITYYDKKTDTYKVIETSDNDATIENDYYSINVSKDSLNYQGTNIMLTSAIENLNTIDKKD